MFHDPVCGMTISWEEATDFEIVGPTVVYFCCAGCAERFRRERTSPAVLSLDLAPRIGTFGLDEFERLLVQEWRRKLGYAPERRCVCRVVERGLLSLALADADPDVHHRLEVLLASEVGRLRSNRLERDRALLELRLLPVSLRSVLAETGMSRGQQACLVQRVAHELPEILRSLERSANSTRTRLASEVCRCTRDHTVGHGRG